MILFSQDNGILKVKEEENMHKIMIVEDDQKNSKLLQSHISKYDYKGVITEDFDHVLDQFEDIQPDLVL